jgi:hypothetical protein
MAIGGEYVIDRLNRQVLLNVGVAVFSIAMADHACAASPIFRCTVNGQTVLADLPCESPPGADSAAVNPDASVGNQVHGQK